VDDRLAKALRTQGGIRRGLYSLPGVFMFGPMRRKDRELSSAEIEALLRDGEYGVLTVVGRNGFPHPIPMSYVYREGEIWLHGAKEGSKLDDIRADSRVSFCVVGQTEVLPEKFSTRYASVILYGTAEEVPLDQAQPCLVALLEKYSHDHMVKGLEYIQRAQDKTCVLRILVQHMTGKARR